MKWMAIGIPPVSWYGKFVIEAIAGAGSNTEWETEFGDWCTLTDTVEAWVQSCCGKKERRKKESQKERKNERKKKKDIEGERETIFFRNLIHRNNSYHSGRYFGYYR